MFENMALWLQFISLSWLVWDLSGSALLSGLAAGLRGLPTLIVGPWAGVVADRWDRRKLVIVTQIILVGARDHHQICALTNCVIKIRFAVVTTIDWVSQVLRISNLTSVNQV